jgi:hypothetical protein
MSTATVQAALYRARRRSYARRLADGLTVWQAGLSVTAGQYVRTATASLVTIAVFIATSSGTTGALSPVPGSFVAQSDGGVDWQLVDSTQVLLTLPTPINTPT